MSVYVCFGGKGCGVVCVAVILMRVLYRCVLCDVHVYMCTLPYRYLIKRTYPHPLTPPPQYTQTLLIHPTIPSHTLLYRYRPYPPSVMRVALFAAHILPSRLNLALRLQPARLPAADSLFSTFNLKRSLNQIRPLIEQTTWLVQADAFR